ncbi:MAG: UvrD-helicase domain-containing protein [Cellulomonadaceae bacterium]
MSEDVTTAVRLSAVEIADLLGRHRPTPEQIDVIEAPLEPLLVVAGAGSGKTETMSARVVFLVANGLVAPDEVLGLTFTRKAAGELGERVRRRLAALERALRRQGESLPGTPLDGGLLALVRRPTVSTYNAYAAQLVGDHALRLGIEPGARLLGEASQWQLASRIVEDWPYELAVDAAQSTVVDAVLALSAALDEHLLDVAEASSRIQEIVTVMAAAPPCGKRSSQYAGVVKVLTRLEQRVALLDLVAEYRRRKRAAETIDFGDQIALAATLAERFAEVREAERDRFRVVLLDEYQDTSYAQARMLGALFGQGHAVTAVGDPFQSIYGWRGASASGLSRFAAQFGGEGGARRLSLSTSWRNDEAVLAVANTVAAPLRAQPGAVPVDALGARPGAGPGHVEAHLLTTAAEEAQAIARFVAEHWRPRSGGQGGTAGGQGGTSAAVLCRKRAQFGPIELALRGLGIPVEIVGLGGLLSEPEVVDVVALLQVVHDPSRGDALMRLLTGPRLALGAADVFAVADRVHELAGHHRRRGRSGSAGDAPGEHTAPEPDLVDVHSIVDVLDELPAPGWTSRAGRTLSAAAHERLQSLARLLDDLRSRTYLSVPELVTAAEQALSLDVEIALRPGARRARATLDTLREVAAAFVDGEPEPTLGAFLAWLDVAESNENGLDQPVSEPDPDAVQLITVHAAKGLEWDAVVVAGLADGSFPTPTAATPDGPRDSGWLTSLRALPYPLRGDAPDLPRFDYADAEDVKDLEERRKAFCALSGAHEVREERRLAYVAVTRARSRLALTSSWFRTGKGRVAPSPFLTEIVDAGQARVVRWDPEPEGDNPALDEVQTASWPTDPGPQARRIVREADIVRATAPGSGPADGPGLAQRARAGDLEATAELLLAERRAATTTADHVHLPSHLSASAMVRLAADPVGYALDLRRPVPAQPSVQAYRGTRFHGWVERYFGSPTLVDVEDLPGDEDDQDIDLSALQAAFLASEWAAREPVAVETDVETPIAGRMTRSRIDAVFADPDRPGGFVVVDWKTGRPPQDETAIRAREVQLAVYRLAWSRLREVPIEQVTAAFFYAATGETVYPRELVGADELVELVRRAQQVRLSR